MVIKRLKVNGVDECDIGRKFVFFLWVWWNFGYGVCELVLDGILRRNVD